MCGNGAKEEGASEEWRKEAIKVCVNRAQARAGPRHQAHLWGIELGYRKVLPFAEGFANLSVLNGN